MDPDAALKALNETVEAGKFDDANDHCNNLDIWLEKGGLAPKWERYPKATEYFQRWKSNEHTTVEC
jgi:hypothetical protein